jgi:hypothetical protein
MKEAIQEYDTTASQEQRLADRLIWYTLDAQEIPAS